MEFTPFTDLRTGQQINSFDEDIKAVFSLSHDRPLRTERVQTKYGIWIHGECPKCAFPVDSWYHTFYCGSCGHKLDWDNM